MALAWTELTQGSSTSNPGTTASITPASGSQVFVAVGMSVSVGSTNAADSMTVSGCGLTWVEVGAVEEWGGRRALRVFRGSGTPSSGTLTITFSTGASATFEQMKWSVDEVTGADATTPIGAAFTSSPGSVTAVSVTISETPDAGDHVYAAFGLEDDNAHTLNSELSNELSVINNTTGCRRVVVAYDSAPDSTPVPGITWTGSTNAVGVAFIINVASAAGITTAVADNLDNWLDAVLNHLEYRIASTDDLNNWLDNNLSSLSYLISKSDSLDAWLDGNENALAGFLIVSITGNLDNWGDAQAFQYEYRIPITDQLGLSDSIELRNVYLINLADNLANYLDAAARSLSGGGGSSDHYKDLSLKISIDIGI